MGVNLPGCSLFALNCGGLSLPVCQVLCILFSHPDANKTSVALQCAPCSQLARCVEYNVQVWDYACSLIDLVTCTCMKLEYRCVCSCAQRFEYYSVLYDILQIFPSLFKENLSNMENIYMGLCGYMWSAVEWSVEWYAKFSGMPLETAYGR